MLPNISRLEISSTDVEQVTSQAPAHKTFAWDFEAGDFVLKDGKIPEVTGAEYVKVWVEKALRTIKGIIIYEGTDYGSAHHGLIGRSFDREFTHAELERTIKEALLINSVITSVSNFEVETDEDRVTLSMTLNTIYGEVIMSNVQ
ncbi:DUF2634 domain-containing protein [Desulfosporosinus nitroreducens]|uniref:DUF2634 domain-containing protein n=1 Tax=Desulfosporosinus nitroreducens TaxID=2018668 RepID=UPI00207C1336|nr:DUF2634 domain-containing protein [Desulfosporosinus nitroreducens]MCO1599819.1 DUF2634 domain-containing protein [Desulfosporosinus nitroreducens]